MNPLYLHYASAIYEVAIEDDQGVRYNNDLALVNLSFRKNPDYLKFLDSELIASDIRIASIDRVYGGRISPAVNGFLKILVRNKGIKHFGDIYKDSKAFTTSSATSSAGRSFRLSPSRMPPLSDSRRLSARSIVRTSFWSTFGTDMSSAA